MPGYTEAQPEQRVVEVTMMNHGHPHPFVISGEEDFIDGDIAYFEGIGRTEPAVAPHYTIEETTSIEQVPGASLAERPMLEPPLPGMPDVDAPINRQVLEAVRPPINPDTVDYIARTLGRAGIQTCGEILRAGLVGLVRAGLMRRDVGPVTALTERLSGQKVTLHGTVTEAES